MRGLIQVAGICNLEEAQMLLDAGVDWLGFPFDLPVHQEDLSKEQAAQIIVETDPSRCVLITYLNRAAEIVPLAKQLGVRKVQLHSDIEIPEIAEVRQRMPHAFIVKSLIVKKENWKELRGSVQLFSPYVDAFITDTYDPVSGASGATGQTHDWNVSRVLAEISSRPLILAGGLTPENVAEAIRAVHPAGVDVHTGVEDALGRKDPGKVAAFIAASRKESF